MIKLDGVRRGPLLLVVYAEQWYKDPVFAKYVVDQANAADGSRCPSFHVGDTPNSSSDIFVMIDLDQGQLTRYTENLPSEFLEQLAAAARGEGHYNGSVMFWIKNLTP